MLFVQSSLSQNLGNTAYGNSVKFVLSLKTDDYGFLESGKPQTHLGQGTQVAIGLLPLGMRIADSQAVVVQPIGSATTASIGLKYIDGSNYMDDISKYAHIGYFASNLDLSQPTRIRDVMGRASLLLPKPAYVVIEINGDLLNSKLHLEVIIDGTLEG